MLTPEIYDVFSRKQERKIIGALKREQPLKLYHRVSDMLYELDHLLFLDRKYNKLSVWPADFEIIHSFSADPNIPESNNTKNNFKYYLEVKVYVLYREDMTSTEFHEKLELLSEMSEEVFDYSGFKHIFVDFTISRMKD